VFVDGKPKKSEYRKFKITTVEGIDDFKSMQEVVGRRYKRMLEEKTDEPDLIIVDGGKGQLSHAVEVLQGLGLYGKIPIIGLAKRLEEVVFPFQSDTLLLPKTSSSLKLLQQVRDEAHRFAIEFHRSLRDKRTLQTELTEIDGVGEKTAQKLLITFGSVEGVRTASDAALEKAVGVKATLKLREHFARNTAPLEE
jgi:excinuclease ABC subunit C